MRIRRGSAWAPVNIALVKHWGYDDEVAKTPARQSLSLTLEHGAKTTVEWDPDVRVDEIVVDGGLISPESGEKAAAAYRLLHSIRFAVGLHGHGARAVSESTLPLSVGMASSAAGAAALTLAGLEAAGLAGLLDDEELISWCHRAGSISAIRSLRGGVVALTTKDGHMGLQGVETPLDLTVLSCLVDPKPKGVSSSDGHMRVGTSPFFREFKRRSATMVAEMVDALVNADFDKVGTLTEADALAMHGVMLTSRPPIIYTRDATWAVWRQVARWREEGLAAFCTLDAGPNPHVLCRAGDADELGDRLGSMAEVLKVWRSRVSPWGGHVLESSTERRVTM